MARQIRINRGKARKPVVRDVAFTVIYLPVRETNGASVGAGRSLKRSSRPLENDEPIAGYQVTVPLLPGLLTYGRTLQEAEEMARDAIECHVEGLKQSGEPIPNERLARKGKLRIALST